MTPPGTGGNVADLPRGNTAPHVAKDDSKQDGTPINFEKSLDELESLVQKMEQGGLTLEESLAQFQRGIELARACQKALSEAPSPMITKSGSR